MQRNADGQICASSQNYPNRYTANEECTIQATGESMLYISEQFAVEKDHDILTVAGLGIDNENYMDDGLFPAYIQDGEVITWTSDYVQNEIGWQFCFGEVEVPAYEMHEDGICDDDTAYNEHECEIIANDMGFLFMTDDDEIDNDDNKDNADEDDASQNPPA